MDIQNQSHNCLHIKSNNCFTLSVQGKNIYKDQCGKCFAEPKSQNGIFVCLKCFNSFCSQTHLPQHSNIFENHSLYLQIQMIELPPPPGGLQITKIAIGKQGGAFGGPQYKTVYKLFCNVCKQSHQNLSDLGNKQLQGLITSLINSDSSYKKQALTQWELQINPCQHTLTLQQNRIYTDLSKCGECDLSNALWLCLTCGHIGCARKNHYGTGGNEHGILHYNQTKHPLVVKSGTITAEGKASVYCYECDEDVTDNYLSEHLKILGIDVATRKKTQKTIQQLVLDQNLNLSLSKIIQQGKKMYSVFGSGFTGMDNIGNSCYLNSVIQLLYSLPEVHQQYFTKGSQHLKNCQKIPMECFYCQLSKIAYGLYSGRYSEKLTRKNIINQKQITEEYQLAIRPFDFKMLIAQKNNQFVSNRQQDAQQYLQWFFDRLKKEQKKLNLNDTPALFDFVAVNKLICFRCNGYKLVQNVTNQFKFPVPLPTKQQIQTFCLKLAEQKNEAVKELKSQQEAQYQVQFKNCLNNLKNGDIVQAFCQKCKQSSSFRTLFLLKSTPKYLITMGNRFVLQNWVPKKLNALINMGDQTFSVNDFLLENNKDGQFQISANSKQSAPQYSQQNLASLLDMGFTKNAAIKALVSNQNNLQAACGWIYQHIDDENLNQPLPTKKKQNKNEPPLHLINQVADMGFTTLQAKVTLLKYNNNVEMSINHLFDTGGDVSDLMHLLQQPKKQQQNIKVSGVNYKKYELYSAIVHLGKSTHSGHYVVYIKKNNKWYLYNDSQVSETEQPVIQKGYIYLFKGINEWNDKFIK